MLNTSAITAVSKSLKARRVAAADPHHLYAVVEKGMENKGKQT